MTKTYQFALNMEQKPISFSALNGFSSLIPRLIDFTLVTHSCVTNNTYYLPQFSGLKQD